MLSCHNVHLKVERIVWKTNLVRHTHSYLLLAEIEDLPTPDQNLPPRELHP